MRVLVLCMFVAGCAAVCPGAEAPTPQRTIKVEFDAPATNYLVRIQEVHRLADELWVISKIMLDPNDEIGGDLVTRVSDQITIEAAENLTVVHWIVGKDWNWGPETKTLRYARDAAQVQQKLKERMAKRIWQRPKDMDPKPEPPVDLTLLDILRILHGTLGTPDATDD